MYLGCSNGLLQRPTLTQFTFTLTYKKTTAVSINFNATSPLSQGTVSPYSNSAHPSASMCAVAQNGLAPIGGGPPEPEDFSTACSCSNLLGSFASVVTSPYVYRDTLTAFETALETFTYITNHQYMYV